MEVCVVLEFIDFMNSKLSVNNKLTIMISLVTVTIKSRHVTVKGPRGTLSRDFKHLSIDVSLVNDGKEIKVDLWFGNRESIAAIRYEIAVHPSTHIHAKLFIELL